MGETETHREAVRRSFTQQAPAFENDRFIGELVSEAEWIFRGLALSPEQTVLDVAAGTGHAARGLAPHVRSVVAIDATKAMLETGHAAASAAGLDNIAFMQGDAYALPFVDATFDVVVCRFAAHHLHEPARLISEMVRCARPGGQVLVADLVADDDTSVAKAQNELELLRDPSHARCLSAPELESLIREAGMTRVAVERHATRRLLAPWLAQTNTLGDEAHAITRALQSEIDGGPATGLSPAVEAGELWFEQRFVAVTARAPV